MRSGPDRDQAAFTMRNQGRSFGAIARELGFDDAPSATEAFLRVLRAQAADTQQSVRSQEHQRLDSLAKHVRGDDTLDATAMARRLAVIDRMRSRLDA